MMFHSRLNVPRGALYLPRQTCLTLTTEPAVSYRCNDLKSAYPHGWHHPPAQSWMQGTTVNGRKQQSHKQANSSTMMPYHDALMRVLTLMIVAGSALQDIIMHVSG